MNQTSDDWDLEQGINGGGGGGNKVMMKPASAYHDNAFQVGIAFYKSPPVDANTNTNPLARQGEEEKGFWKRYVENPLIRKFTKDMVYKHCEIAFTKDLIQGTIIPEGCVLAYGIVRDGVLFGKPRTFSSDQYRWKWMNMPKKQCLDMQRFCEAQVGKPYDSTAAKRSAFWPKSTNAKQWYCTDFVVTALQQGGIMLGTNPRAQTTDDVYDIIQQQGNLVQRNSPFQRIKNEKTADARIEKKDPKRMVHMEPARRNN